MTDRKNIIINLTKTTMKALSFSLSFYFFVGHIHSVSTVLGLMKKGSVSLHSGENEYLAIYNSIEFITEKLYMFLTR